MDWGKGEYERTARELVPAASAAVDALHPQSGQLILDVACGTGNAAILAAAHGAKIAGVDGSPRLIEIAERRARTEAVDGEWRVADMHDLPYPDNRFDGVISVFGVIFAQDANTAATELVRVAKPGGTIVITAWLPRGPIGDVMKVIRQTVAEFTPEDAGSITSFDWSNGDRLRDLFGPDTEVTDHHISFKGSSAGAWVLEQCEFHPAWMELKKVIPGERYERMLDEVTQIVAAANGNPDGLELVSDYVIARARA